MFPRRPVGSDGGPSGGLKGIVCNLTHILGYVVTFILHLGSSWHRGKELLLQLEGLPVQILGQVMFQGASDHAPNSHCSPGAVKLMVWRVKDGINVEVKFTATNSMCKYFGFLFLSSWDLAPL